MEELSSGAQSLYEMLMAETTEEYESMFMAHKKKILAAVRVSVTDAEKQYKDYLVGNSASPPSTASPLAPSSPNSSASTSSAPPCVPSSDVSIGGFSERAAAASSSTSVAAAPQASTTTDVSTNLWARAELDVVHDAAEDLAALTPSTCSTVCVADHTSSTTTPATSTTVSSLLGDLTALSVAPVAVDIKGTDLAALVPINCSSECPSHDDVSVFVLSSPALDLLEEGASTSSLTPATYLLEDVDISMLSENMLPPWPPPWFVSFQDVIRCKDMIQVLLSDDLILGSMQLMFWAEKNPCPLPSLNMCTGIQNILQLHCQDISFMPRTTLIPLHSESVEVIRSRIRIWLCCFSSQGAQLLVFCFAACSISILQCTMDIMGISGDWHFLRTVEIKWNAILAVTTSAHGVQFVQLQPKVFKWSHHSGHDTHYLLASVANVNMMLGLLLVRRASCTVWISCCSDNLHCSLGNITLAIPDWVMFNLSPETRVFGNCHLARVQNQWKITVQVYTSSSVVGRYPSSNIFVVIFNGEAEVQRYCSCTRILTDARRKGWNHRQTRRGLLKLALTWISGVYFWTIYVGEFLLSIMVYQATMLTTSTVPQPTRIGGFQPWAHNFGIECEHLHWPCFPQATCHSRFSDVAVHSLVHAERESWFQFCPAGNASIYSYGTAQFLWEIAWPPTTLAYSIPYEEFRKIACLFVGSRWASSEFGRSGTVSVRELSFRRYPTPLVNPIVLKVYHPLSVADPLEVGLLFVVPVQDGLLSCFDRQIIQYRFAGNQWEIDWSFNVQYPPGGDKFAQLSCVKPRQLSLLADWSLSYSAAAASCHYLSSSKISASTIQLHAFVAIWFVPEENQTCLPFLQPKPPWLLLMIAKLSSAAILLMIFSDNHCAAAVELGLLICAQPHSSNYSQWEIAWLLVWPSGAESDFEGSGLVTITFWLYFKLESYLRTVCESIHINGISLEFNHYEVAANRGSMTYGCLDFKQKLSAAASTLLKMQPVDRSQFYDAFLFNWDIKYIFGDPGGSFPVLDAATGVNWNSSPQPFLHLTWDPGGSTQHRLVGKPNFKKGGLSTTCLLGLTNGPPPWAVACSRARQGGQHEAYMRRRAARRGRLGRNGLDSGFGRGLAGVSRVRGVCASASSSSS